jgi:hypothetical protein
MQYVFYREKEPGLLWKRWLAVKQSEARKEVFSAYIMKRQKMESILHHSVFLFFLSF